MVNSWNHQSLGGSPFLSDQTRCFRASSSTSSPENSWKPGKPRMMCLSPSPERVDSKTCFTASSHNGDCSLEQFLLWTEFTSNGRQEDELSVVWVCPMIRCRRPFSGQAVMLQHLRGCDELNSAAFWCQKCCAIESFSHLKCQQCPFRNLEEGSSAPFLEPLGCAMIPSLAWGSTDLGVLQQDDSNSSSNEASSSPCMDQDVLQITNSGVLIPQDGIETASAEPRLALDPNLCLSSQLPSRVDGHNPSMSSTSPVLGANAESNAHSRSDSPSVPFTLSLSTTTIAPGNNYRVGDSGSERTDSWDDAALSEGSDGLFSRGDPRLMNIALCDELPTSTNLLVGTAPSELLETTRSMGGTAASHNPDATSGMISAFTNEDISSRQPRYGRGGPTFETPNLGSDSGISGDDEMAFRMVQNVPQPHTIQPGHQGDFYPQPLLAATWSTLRTHLDSSLRKLGQIYHNPLVTQFSIISQKDVVDRGLSVAAAILAGRQCNSPLGLICFMHLSYAMSLVANAEVYADGSRDRFSQAISYVGWLEGREQQAYIDMVDTLWRPTDMALTDVFALLQADGWSANGVRDSSATHPQAGYSSQAGPNAGFLEDVLDELEFFMLQNMAVSRIGHSTLHRRHLEDLEMTVHHSHHFLDSVTLLLRRLVHEFSDAPQLSNSFVDILNRVKESRFATARRIELQVLNIGRMHLSPRRFLSHYSPRIRGAVDSLYAANPAPESQRLSYRQHGISLMKDLFGAMERGQQSFGSPRQEADNIHWTPNMDGLAIDSNSVSCLTIGTVFPGLPKKEGMQRGSVGRAPGGAPPSSSSSPPDSWEGRKGGEDSSSSPKIESNTTCTLCGYRPKGDPRWFGGSMAKHMKLQHATTPPKIYRCPYPGCTSQFQKRPDNLRQHQIEKRHFVDGQGDSMRRTPKKKKP